MPRKLLAAYVFACTLGLGRCAEHPDEPALRSGHDPSASLADVLAEAEKLGTENHTEPTVVIPVPVQ